MVPEMYESLYIHLPFCASRCAYCNFYTEVLSPHKKKLDDHLEGLIKDIRAYARQGFLRELKTLYLGGGTPTHFGHSRLVELVYTLSLSIKFEQIREFTLEANPESLDVALIKDLYALGINRISLGAQSFVDKELKVLGRAHDAAKIVQAVAVARERFENVNLDLICGIPGQDLESWGYSLDCALQLNPEHLSVYPLQVEEDTPLARAIERGELPYVDEDEQAFFLEQAAQTLKAEGYVHYEVASYAKPHRECQHNIAYWTGSSYLGLGEGAASMLTLDDGTRIRSKNGGEIEKLSAREAQAEDIFLAMRMERGLSKQALVNAEVVLPGVLKTFIKLQELGLTVLCGDRYIPSNKGWLLGNELYGRIWALASQDC